MWASVGELAARLPVSRPAVSQHLKVLRDAGLVVVHDRLDAHGPGWETVRDGVGSDGGWPAGLRQLAQAAVAS
jgi:DNA-binding transcriptional ArsR family regulator